MISGMPYVFVSSSKNSTQKSDSNVFEMRHAGTLRVDQSMIATGYRKPRRVRMQV